MELRHIRYFIRVAELLHFTHAAESLHVSQPTLSTHIQQLEEEIGCPLFDRGRNLRLTEAGRLLLARAHESYRQLELAKEEIGVLRRLVRGTLTIGATYVFIPKIVPRVLAAYAAAYPEVQVSMHVGNSHQIAQEVMARTIDVGLACMSHDSKFEYEELFRDEVVLIVSQQHALADRTEIDVQELGGFPLLLPSTGFSTRRFLDQHFMKEKISPKVLLEIDDFPALLTMVKTDDVATVGCRGAVANDPGVHVVSLSGVGSPFTLSKGLIRSGDLPLSAAARAFVELTKSQFASPGVSQKAPTRAGRPSDSFPHSTTLSVRTVQFGLVLAPTLRATGQRPCNFWPSLRYPTRRNDRIRTEGFGRSRDSRTQQGPSVHTGRESRRARNPGHPSLDHNPRRHRSGSA